VEKKKRRLGAMAPYMDEVYSLTLDLGREVGKLVEAVFDLAPIVGILPVGDEALQVIDPDPRRPAPCVGKLSVKFRRSINAR
jgi:hypothetical protein